VPHVDVPDIDAFAAERARDLAYDAGSVLDIDDQFVFRREDAAPAPALAKRIAGFTGGAAPEEGEYCYGDFSPLVTFREFELLVRGWIVTGEMVAACTRAGRMPILWMSVWLEGAMVRNAYFIRHNNLREPWQVPLFHDNHYVPPLAAGYVGNSFLDFLENIRICLVKQADRLRLAGQWLAEAVGRSKRTWVVLVGHSYPEILGCGSGHQGEKPRRDYPLCWGWSNSDLRHALPHDFGPGDTGLHLGYGPTRADDVAGWLKRGVRLIHTSPYGRPAGLRDHARFIWFDLPWRPADATVDVPGYSVRLLPGSSASQTMAYFAILSETAEAAGWDNANCTKEHHGSIRRKK